MQALEALVHKLVYEGYLRAIHGGSSTPESLSKAKLTFLSTPAQSGVASQGQTSSNSWKPGTNPIRPNCIKSEEINSSSIAWIFAHANLP